MAPLQSPISAGAPPTKRAPQCCWFHRPSCMRRSEGLSPPSPTSFDRTQSLDDTTGISQPPVYHVVAGGTTLANLIRVESKVPMTTSTASRPQSRSVLTKERWQIQAGIRWRVLTRIRAPWSLCGLVWRCVCSEGGRLNSIMPVTNDWRHQPSFSRRKSLANARFNLRSSLHKRNRPQHWVVACRVEIRAGMFPLRTVAPAIAA